MADCIVGKYKLESSDNFDEYMKAIGVGLVTRKMGASATPVVTVSRQGADQYSIKTETTLKTSEINFRLNEQFNEETLDGRQVQSVVTQPAPNRLVQVQRKDDFESSIQRDFSPEGLTTVLNYKNIVCTRKYKRVNE